MAITKIEKDMSIVSKLSALPNATDGLTYQEFQAKFDEGGLALKNYINNTLIPALQSVTDNSSGADQIGTTTIESLDGTTVQAILESIRNKLKSTTDSTSGADFVGATSITGLTGTTVQSLIESLKSYADTLDGQNVKKTGAQTVSGVKTFSDSPVVPTPTTDMQASTKKYVDDKDTARKSYIDTNFDTSEEITNNRKLDKTGNFTGSWFGFDKPSASEPGIQAQVDSNTAQLAEKVKKGELVINVKDYGVVGDGITDDTQAIQSAIDEAKGSVSSIGSEITGAVVFFPEGHYLVEGTLDLSNNSGVSLVGQGKTKSTIEMGKNTSVLLDFTNCNNYRGEIKGLRLTGGINAGTGDLIKITGGGNQIDIVDNWIDSRQGGINANPLADCLIKNNTFEYVNKAIYGSNLYDLIISDNMFYAYGAKGTGVQPNNFDFVNAYRCIFKNNKIIYDSSLAQTNAIINVENAHDFIVDGNLLYDKVGSQLPAVAIHILNAQRVSVVNNKIGRTLFESIKIDGSKGVNVIGNSLVGTTNSSYHTIALKGGSEDINVSNNTFAQVPNTDYTNLANSFDILLDGCVRVSVTNNKTRKKIYVQSNSSRYFIQGNHCSTDGEPNVKYYNNPPQYQQWEVGDIIYNPSPSASGSIGWVCVASGTPGTWKTFGVISS